MPLPMFTKKLGDQKIKKFCDNRVFPMPGDVSLLPSGYDAWVVGNEPAVVVDFQGMIEYAKSKRDTNKS
jgi:hypothetical protein